MARWRFHGAIKQLRFRGVINDRDAGDVTAGRRALGFLMAPPLAIFLSSDGATNQVIYLQKRYL